MPIEMDLTSITATLRAIASGGPTVPGEPRAAVAWLKSKIWITPRDKGAQSQYQPHIAAAEVAARQAAACHESGDGENAKKPAQEALDALARVRT